MSKLRENFIVEDEEIAAAGDKASCLLATQSCKGATLCEERVPSKGKDELLFLFVTDAIIATVPDRLEMVEQRHETSMAVGSLLPCARGVSSRPSLAGRLLLKELALDASLEALEVKKGFLFHI